MSKESQHLPFVTCLCPTYRRPTRLVANAIACFERQTYPADYRRLIVLDDAGELTPQVGPNWQIVSMINRYRTLPAKYNALATLASGADVLVVWEDDDIYLPWHIEAHVAALADHAWSHPSRVWSLYTGQLRQEPAGRRFHAALVVRCQTLAMIGGWPDTPRADFDQLLMAALSRRFGMPADPCEGFVASYVFRWGSTGSYHGQAFMRGNDPDWYDRAVEQTEPAAGPVTVTPGLDAETKQLFGILSRGGPPRPA